MAKKVENKEIKPETEEQVSLLESVSDDVEKTAMCNAAIATYQKLEDKKSKLSVNDLDNLFNFYESDSFNLYYQKSTLDLSSEQKDNLIEAVIKLNKPEYVKRILQSSDLIHITSPDNKKFINFITKDRDLAMECAIKFRENQNVSWGGWCYELVVKPLEKDLSSKNPSEESYARVAELIFKTATEEDLAVHLMYYADKIFGSDEDIKKNEKEKNQDKIFEKKSRFTENVKKAYVEILDADKLAREDVHEEETKNAEEDAELEQNEGFQKAVDLRANELFNEKYQADFAQASSFMEQLKKEHPKDLDAYLKKLRSSKAYKEAYEKYSKEYAEAKEALKEQAKSEIKTMMKEESKKQAIEEVKGKTDEKENTEAKEEEMLPNE